MKKNIVWIIAIIIAITLFISAYILYDQLKDNYTANNLETSKKENSTSTNAEDEEEHNTNQAPDFTVYTSEGKAVKLSDYFGRPIVMNFWASWCSPCKAEMPHFEEAYKEHSDVTFLMINMTSGDNRNDAEALIKNERYTFPVLFDTEGNAAMTYGASSLPTTFFIDKNGRFVTYAVGMLDKATLEKGIDMIK